MSVRDRSPVLPFRQEGVGLPTDFPLRAVGWDMPDHRIRDLHAHEALELGYCHAGSGSFLVGGAMTAFRTGSCLIVAPGTLHRARSDSGSTSRWTFCWLDAARLLAGLGVPQRLLRSEALAGPRFTALCDPAAQPALSSLFAALAAEATGRADREVLRGLVWAALAACHRLPGCGGSGTDAVSLQRLGPALAAIQADPATVPLIAALARRCRLSPATLRRAFHRVVGCSPRDFALRLRVQHAAELLRHERMGVTEAALASGFASANGLARRFRAVLGTSPRAWRCGRH